MGYFYPLGKTVDSQFFGPSSDKYNFSVALHDRAASFFPREAKEREEVTIS